MRQFKKINAFSFIELSIVILVVGILIAGVTTGSSLVRKAQLQSARNLTTSSPVPTIKKLAVWFETSLETSFLSTQAMDGAIISVWHDNNPQASSKNNAVQTDESSRPIFYENVFPGGIPGVRFDGSDDALEFDGNFLAQTDYTVFIVEQKRSDKTYNFFLGGQSVAKNTNLHIGYFSDTLVTVDQFINNMNYVNASFAFNSSGPTPRIHTALLKQKSGLKYWLNGGKTSDASSSNKTPLISNAGAALGQYYTLYFYEGDIAEAIFYTKALNDEERQAVEAYLGKKYSIEIE